MTTLTKTYKLSVKTKENYYINKNILMKTKVNILSSGKIKNQLNKNTYLNIDIPSSSLVLKEEDKIIMNDYILMFNDYDSLSNIKNYMQHPYEISSVKISDISYYLQKLNLDLLILENVDEKDRQCFNALNVSNRQMDKQFVPISAIEFKFDI